MKKNVMLKIAAVLLVAVLLSTCAISATFAKYVTDAGSHTETARVAKWGVVATIDTTETMFSNEYDGTVASSDGAAVVAPGTKGEYTVTLAITSDAPEVAFKAVMDDDDDPTNGFGKDFIVVNDPDFAAQLTWTLNGEESDLQKVNNAIANMAAKVYQPNDKVNYTNTVEIGWEWTFDTNDDDSAFGADDAYEDLNIDFNVYASLEQVD